MTRVPTLCIYAAALSLAFGLHTASASDEGLGEGYEDLGRPMLGVVMTPPSSRDLRSNDLDTQTGVVVRRVYDNTAAQDMGLQPGDVITEINGVPIENMSKLREVIQSYLPGDEVHVTGRRQGQDLQRDGFLNEWPESVPFRDIDARAEARYRRMVERRLARQAETLDRLANEQQALAQEVEALRQQQDQKADRGSDRPHTAPGADLGSIMSAALAGDAHQLMAMPNWRFSYGFAVEQDRHGEAMAAGGPSASQQTDESALRFSFAVSDDLR